MHSNKSLEELVTELSPENKKEVRDFVEFLLEKKIPKPKGRLKLDWRGALKDLRDQYSSVELQHISFDKDFEQTIRGRKTPSEILGQKLNP